MLVPSGSCDFGSTAKDRFLLCRTISCARRAVDDDLYSQGAVAERDLEVELATARCGRAA
ncbi:MULTISPECIES: hypothetical protein [unclassified Bradyrhizobium]|uniref:hypothetical protein n=1 Tax=unclassified Bradyrhizobium TaxID=2631580 RepID=UPI0012EC37BC|nr:MULTISPECIES: hypothetical protein [unclassified Bradyrhizobium]MCP3460632.1 hypothetical protein [Bradyrhizobium sp. CCGUVB23]